MGPSPQWPKPRGETSINRGLHQQRRGPEFVIQNSSPQGLNFSLKLKTIYLKLRVFIPEEASKEHILETSSHLYSSSTYIISSLHEAFKFLPKRNFSCEQIGTPSGTSLPFISSSKDQNTSWPQKEIPQAWAMQPQDLSLAVWREEFNMMNYHPLESPGIHGSKCISLPKHQL